MFNGPEPTEEDIAKAKAEYDKAVMYGEMLTQRVRRMIAEELSHDQLEALQAMFAHISNSAHPIIIANWYEGIVHGTLAVRDIVLGEKEPVE